MHKNRIIQIVTLFFFTLNSQFCTAFDWTSSDIQQLYGSDFELGDANRHTTTVEHAHGWKYGQNFFLSILSIGMILA